MGNFLFYVIVIGVIGLGLAMDLAVGAVPYCIALRCAGCSQAKQYRYRSKFYDSPYPDYDRLPSER